MSSKNSEGLFCRLLTTVRRVFERKPAKPTSEVQEVLDKLERVNSENQGLKEELDQQSQELAWAQQQVTDLKAEWTSLKQQVELAETEVDGGRTDALVSLFKEMANERHNRLLRKLLAFNGDEPKLLRDLARYLRDDLKLALEGAIDDEVTLTEENLDRYELQEAVTLPCRARIIGRGISFEGRPILRTEVELIDNT
jgi:septal ring factor EnvC (AmiA/AmiB activator)